MKESAIFIILLIYLHCGFSQEFSDKAIYHPVKEKNLKGRVMWIMADGEFKVFDINGNLVYSRSLNRSNCDKGDSDLNNSYLWVDEEIYKYMDNNVIEKERRSQYVRSRTEYQYVNNNLFKMIVHTTDLKSDSSVVEYIYKYNAVNKLIKIESFSKSKHYTKDTFLYDHNNKIAEIIAYTSAHEIILDETKKRMKYNFVQQKYYYPFRKDSVVELYKNGKMIKEIDYDNASTKEVNYFYDRNNYLVKEIIKNSMSGDNDTVLYQYRNGMLVKKIKYNKVSSMISVYSNFDRSNNFTKESCYIENRDAANISKMDTCYYYREIEYYK